MTSKGVLPAGKTAGANDRDISRTKSNKSAAKIIPPQLRPRPTISSYYENNDFESVWLSEFLSHEKKRHESIANADLLNFTELPGSTVHPHAASHLIRKSKCSKKQSLDGGKFSGISDHERQRLDGLSKTLNAEKNRTTKGKKGQKKLTPYVDANSKISRVLQHTKPKGKKEDMQASQLNDFYKIVTIETSAAVTLQSQWRRLMATEYVNKVSLRTKQAIKIQSFVRGNFAQKKLKRLKEEKRRASSMREQLVRVHVARCRRRKRIRLEHISAVACQSVIRMFFAKRIAQLRRLQHSWELNQHRWKAISARLAWADLRINFYARQIQCVVRRKLAQRRVSNMFAVHTKAAIFVQSIWRSYQGRQQKSDMIYQRKVDKRCNKIRIIASEHHYWKQQVEETTKPAKLQLKKDLEMQKDQLKKELCEKYEQINALETHYKEQFRLQQQMTPMSIAGGLEEQVKINLKDARERITKVKLDMFFHTQKKLKSVMKEIDQIQSNEANTRTTMAHWSTCHQVEQDRLWDFQRKHDKEVEEKEKRHSIINEQMRWAVKFCVPSGKPDKRRPLLDRSDNYNDGDPSSSERLQQLLYATKLKADDFQAANHIDCTYQPFQQMWDQCNSLSTNNHPTKRSDSRQIKTSNALHSEFENGSFQIQRPRKKPFPQKLPWNLLGKTREDRQDIRVKFEPK